MQGPGGSHCRFMWAVTAETVQMQYMSVAKHIVKQLAPPVLWEAFLRLKRRVSQSERKTANRYRGKVFCVGLNKTGTTSLEYALRSFGYRLGAQGVGAMLFADWQAQKWERLIRFCQSAEAFQDIPFSLPGTYRILDEAFPDSKFVLSIRDSKDQWFESMVRFHKRKFSSDRKRLPDQEDLESVRYPYMGYQLDIMKTVYGYPSVSLYDSHHYKMVYERHNERLVNYFRARPDKLLVLNVSEPNALQRLGAFLNVKVSETARFPWKNRT